MAIAKRLSELVTIASTGGIKCHRLHVFGFPRSSLPAPNPRSPAIRPATTFSIAHFRSRRLPMAVLAPTCWRSATSRSIAHRRACRQKTAPRKILRNGAMMNATPRRFPSKHRPLRNVRSGEQATDAGPLKRSAFYAAAIFAATRVDLDLVAGGAKQRHRHLESGMEASRFQHLARGVAAHCRLGVGNFTYHRLR